VHRYPYTAWLSGLTDPAAAGAATSRSPARHVEGLSYVGCAPFDFGSFDGYRHQATSQVDRGALDVATECRTHVWRPSGPPQDGSATQPLAVKSSRPDVPRKTKKARTASGEEATKGNTVQGGDTALPEHSKEAAKQHRKKKKFKHASPDSA
jgi:hypothetical protein